MILLDSIVQPTLSFVSPIITTSVFRGLIGLMDSKVNRFSLMASQAFQDESSQVFPGFLLSTICFGGKFVSITLVENHATSFNMLKAHCRMRRVGFRILFRLLLRRVLRSGQFLKKCFCAQKVLSCCRWLLLNCNKKKVTKWTQIVKRACHTEWSFFLASRWRKKSAMPAHWKYLSWHACNELCKKNNFHQPPTTKRKLHVSSNFVLGFCFASASSSRGFHPVMSRPPEIRCHPQKDPKGIVIWVTCFIPKTHTNLPERLPKLYLQARRFSARQPRLTNFTKIIQKSAEGCTGWKLVND